MLIVSLRPDSGTGVTVRGTALDETGAVIPEARVGLYSADQEWEGRTDAAGTFQFVGVPPGTYEVQISVTGFVTQFQNIRVGGTDPAPISVTLPVRGVPCCADDCNQPPVIYASAAGKELLTGSILRSDDSPLAGAKVSLSRMSDDKRLAVVRTTRRGEFRFSDLKPGRYHLRVSHRGYFDRGIADLRVRPGKTATVTVLMVQGHGLEVCQ
jgi:uncharacterized membrane protein